jgi:hypothetical protein
MLTVRALRGMRSSEHPCYGSAERRPELSIFRLCFDVIRCPDAGWTHMSGKYSSLDPHACNGFPVY